MAEDKPVDIFSDAPELDAVEFGFNEYARTLAGLIANKTNKTPLVIGIYGPWGSGKTTLMEKVRELLRSDDFKDKVKYRKCKTVWFQAWKYANEEEILAALIEEIFKTMKRDGFLERSKEAIEELVNKLKPSKALEQVVKTITGIDITEIFSELEYKQKLGFYDTFQDFFERLLWTYTRLRPKLDSSEEPDDTKGALVVFIDDLDRCPRDKILKVLETIKLFMDKKGSIFVIGAANDIIEQALEKTYAEDAPKFMDKIVQVTFNLPQIAASNFAKYMENLHVDLQGDILPHLPLIIPAMQYNPRQFKRFLNNLSLQAGLLRNSGVEIDPKHVMYWSIIEYVNPKLASEIRERPENLFILQKHITEVRDAVAEDEMWTITSESLSQVPQHFHSYFRNKPLIDIVSSFEITTEQTKELRELVTLSAIVESAEETREKKEKEKQFQEELDVMVEVPTGDFSYQDGKASISEPYFIDIYPVTNRQFAKFIEAGGYRKDEHWKPDGKKWREKQTISQPAYWEDEEWNQPEHPVVGVSYFEAEAYACWAGKRLPTEEEWERAARGTEGREYPWGNDFDLERCNTRESGIEKTTRVTRYPNGISPAGCYDMAGNVWEWTFSWFDEAKGEKVLRGGSWGSDRDAARCSLRSRTFPSRRDNFVGFVASGQKSDFPLSFYTFILCPYILCDPRTAIPEHKKTVRP